MKMGMRRGGVLAVGALALLAACSGGGDDPPPPPPPTTGAVTVVNSHCIPIEELYLVPSTSMDWGANQLTASVAPGASFTVSNVPPGSYDVMAVAADGVAWEDYGIPVVAGATYPWPFPMPAGKGCLQVVNSSAFTVRYLWAARASSGACTYGGSLWGTEQLQSWTIAPGQSFTLSNMDAGYDYDLLAQDTTGGGWDTCQVPPKYVAAGQTTIWTLY